MKDRGIAMKRVTLKKSVSDNYGCDDKEYSNEGIDKTEQEKNSAAARIKHCIMRSLDLKVNDWVTVEFLRAWYSGKFI